MKSRGGGAPVLIVTHLPDPTFGLVADALAERELDVVHWNLLTAPEGPAASAISGIVSLGGQMSVTNLSAFPMLLHELELMQAGVRSQLPIFGLCLGAQLLALAAGGRVTTMPHRFIGWPLLTLTHAGREDILFRDCPSDIPVIKWHADAIEVPPTATVLASTASPGCAVFRVGRCAWGSQMHLEADAEMLFDRWLPDPIEQRALLEAGLDPVTFAAGCKQRVPNQVAAMTPVFSRFADYVVESQAAAGA